jgi:hypothetical protein
MTAAHRFDPQQASIASVAADSSALFHAARVEFILAIPLGATRAETDQADLQRHDAGMQPLIECRLWALPRPAMRLALPSPFRA